METDGAGGAGGAGSARGAVPVLPRARARMRDVAALAGFSIKTVSRVVNGEGGVYPTGTWMIGQFEGEAADPARPLYRSYAVFPYPRLFGRDVAFVSGHAWVVPRRDRTPAERAAIARLFRFMADHNFDWARTGHLPAFRQAIDSPRFRALPHRATSGPSTLIEARMRRTRS